MPPIASSKPALWSTLAMACAVTLGSLGPFRFRAVYAGFLNRRIPIYGTWYFTPHSLLHVLSFGVLGFLAALISTRWSVRGCIIAGILLLGLAIEWIQFQSHPGNPFESWDLRSDVVGVCLGALVALGAVRAIPTV